MPCSMWDPSSLTRDQTCAFCSGSRILTTGPPGKSQETFSIGEYAYFNPPQNTHFLKIPS